MFLGSSRSQGPIRPKILLLGSKKVGKTSLIIRYVDKYFLDTYYPTIVRNDFVKNIRFDVDGNVSESNNYYKMGGKNDGNNGEILIENNLNDNVQNNNNNNNSILEIIDLCGINYDDIDDKFINLKILNDINGIIFIYDVNNYKSFKNIELLWNKLLDESGIIELLNKIDIKEEKMIILPMMLIGNKIDLRDIPQKNNDINNKNFINKEDGRKMCERMIRLINNKIKNNNKESKSKIKIKLDIGFAETSVKLNLNINESINILLKKIYLNFNKNINQIKSSNNDELNINKINFFYNYGINFNFDEYQSKIGDDTKMYFDDDEDEQCIIS